MSFFHYSFYHSSVNKLFSGFGQTFCWSYTDLLSHISSASALTESLLQLFYDFSHSFFLYIIISFKFWYFSFLLIFPLWWCSKMFLCFMTSFIVFFDLSIPADYNSFYQDSFSCNLFSSDMLNIQFIFLDHLASSHLSILFNSLNSILLLRSRDILFILIKPFTSIVITVYFYILFFLKYLTSIVF